MANEKITISNLKAVLSNGEIIDVELKLNGKDILITSGEGEDEISFSLIDFVDSSLWTDITDF